MVEDFLNSNNSNAIARSSPLDRDTLLALMANTQGLPNSTIYSDGNIPTSNSQISTTAPLLSSTANLPAVPTAQPGFNIDDFLSHNSPDFSGLFTPDDSSNGVYTGSPRLANYVEPTLESNDGSNKRASTRSTRSSSG